MRITNQTIRQLIAGGLILSILVIVGLLYWYHIYENELQSMTNNEFNYLQVLSSGEKYSTDAAPAQRTMILAKPLPVVDSPVLLPQEHSILVYITALYNSVKIFQLPFTKSQFDALYDCDRYNKESMFNNQHSLEMRYPYMLGEMSEISAQSDKYGDHTMKRFGVQWKNRSILNSELNINGNTLNGVFDEPLFHYVQSYLYYVVYCTYKPRGKENWKQGMKYLEEIPDYVVNTAEWAANMGLDFLSPASHPKSGPIAIDPLNLNYFRRQTFLRTDFDFTGYLPKDLVMPYYVAYTDKQSRAKLMHRKIQENVNKKLIFFAGNKNPPGGLRTKLESAFEQVIVEERFSDIFYTTDGISATDYKLLMFNSDFCLSVRGDTSSSARLFAAIEAGCIPVVISDWLLLPFESLIDYSKFLIKFPESIVNDVGALIAYLRGVSTKEKYNMRQALLEARNMLLYQSSQTEYHLMNPVTLSLVELFIRRKKYCDQLGASAETSLLCQKIYNRLKMAVKLVT